MRNCFLCLQVFVLWDDTVQEQSYATMFALQTKNPKAPVSKLILGFPNKYQQVSSSAYRRTFVDRTRHIAMPHLGRWCVSMCHVKLTGFCTLSSSELVRQWLHILV